MSDEDELIDEAKEKLASAYYLMTGGFYKDAVSRADYAVGVKITKEEAQAIIEDAEAFIKRIEKAIHEMKS